MYFFQLHYSIKQFHFYLFMNVILKDNDPIHLFTVLIYPGGCVFILNKIHMVFMIIIIKNEIWHICKSAQSVSVYLSVLSLSVCSCLLSCVCNTTEGICLTLLKPHVCCVRQGQCYITPSLCPLPCVCVCLGRCRQTRSYTMCSAPTRVCLFLCVSESRRFQRSDRNEHVPLLRSDHAFTRCLTCPHTHPCPTECPQNNSCLTQRRCYVCVKKPGFYPLKQVNIFGTVCLWGFFFPSKNIFQ